MKDSDCQTQEFGFETVSSYLVDACQRSILFLDTLRKRGNQYHKHMRRKVPHVLNYRYEIVIDGRTLPEPVNYGLARIIPPEGLQIDDRKRPFVVIDPRAGHGPGIGGFKADSEIGVILSAGHPCYFIGFSPVPEPDQTIEAVMRAEAMFVKRVIENHPEADGTPVLIGNCQAGWAIMMLAATCPDLCGPIIAAGSPMSYWGGVRGQYPMRYTGGMLAGSWLTAFTSDIGNGKFDGAWLVQNFENLNPANTFWAKQYNLYAKVDTEVPRYLGFERWWGGHVILSGDEIQYIVDNLFVGNKLSSADIQTSDGMRIDLRNIRSPVVCFCSKGDNITPPQQALGWILDLYDSVDDIRSSGQTIIYAVHDRIGHLGIFVSGGVAKKEHYEFASNIDFIDCMPPGLYEAVIEKTSDGTANPDLVTGDYISRFERRTLDDIRALGVNSLEDERCFATVARLSKVNHGLYRTYAQPVVRALATETGAQWLRQVHPLRVGYDLFSDRNPMMQAVATAADWVKENRQPVSGDNPFWQWQDLFSDWMINSLDFYREWRDTMVEQTFFAIYNQPWLQALMGLNASDEAPRRHPGQEPDHLALIAHRKVELMSKIDQGAPREALLRGLIYVRLPVGASDERGFEVIRRLREEDDERLSLSEFKEAFREQYFILLMDEKKAIETLPSLLKDYPDHGPEIYKMIHEIATADAPLPEEAERRLTELKKLFATEKKVVAQKEPAKS